MRKKSVKKKTTPQQDNENSVAAAWLLCHYVSEQLKDNFPKSVAFIRCRVWWRGCLWRKKKSLHCLHLSGHHGSFGLFAILLISSLSLFNSFNLPFFHSGLWRQKRGPEIFYSFRSYSCRRRFLKISSVFLIFSKMYDFFFIISLEKI